MALSAAATATLTTGAAPVRMPTLFLPHGGGPWPVLDLPFGLPGEGAALKAHLQGVARGIPTPRAILVISAHWETDVVTVHTGAAPGMLYDYGGFPDAAYRLQWPAKGAPGVAQEVLALLSEAGIPTRTEADRGFDHGTFIPLMLAFPEADVPVVQVSMLRSLDPAAHLALGRALAPLRDRGVLIVGSGNSFHDLRSMFRPTPQARQAAAAFDRWLSEVVAAPAAERDAALAAWNRAPGARRAHPREEHLLPLHVAAGAAGVDPGRVAWTGGVNGLVVSSHRFG
jgi:aromatic ring-opening dioxygenase catalytic subunit (LigB family)